MMKFMIAAAAVALAAGSASAQTTMTSPSAFGGGAIIGITSTFRTSVTVTEPQAIPNAGAQDTARRALYTMAEGECVALSQIFKAECRLSSVSILFPAEPYNAATPNTMSATAIYELRPSRPSAGR